MSASLQIEYVEGYCQLQAKYFDEFLCGDCNMPGRADCPFYRSKSTERRIDDTCMHLGFVHKYKGMTTKSYEIEEDKEWPGLCMRVTVRGKEYCCSKVILDGVTIFPENEEVVRP